MNQKTRLSRKALYEHYVPYIVKLLVFIWGVQLLIFSLKGFEHPDAVPTFIGLSVLFLGLLLYVLYYQRKIHRIVLNGKVTVATVTDYRRKTVGTPAGSIHRAPNLSFYKYKIEYIDHLGNKHKGKYSAEDEFPVRSIPVIYNLGKPSEYSIFEDVDEALCKYAKEKYKHEIRAAQRKTRRRY